MKLKKFGVSLKREAHILAKLAEEGIAHIKGDAFLEPEYHAGGEFESFEQYRETAVIPSRIPGWISRDELFSLTDSMLREDYEKYKALHADVD